MRRAFHLTLLLAICTAIIAPTLAQDKQKRKKGKGNRKGQAASKSVMSLVKDVNLTADQKPKVAAIAKEWGPKLQAATKKRNGILTAEQKKAQSAARKQAVKDGKNGREAQKAAMDALKLTKEQKEKFTAAQKEYRELRASVVKKIGELLTDEQKAKVPGLRKRKGKGKGKGKGKKKKKDE